MSETTMPATEAAVASELETELQSYELAFHVLPTVAEGEVATVFAEIKKLIKDASGVITIEESPARFDLAYEIEKPLEGKNRKFSSAYFGWVRFTLSAENIAALTAEIDTDTRLLRYLLIRLTRVEEAHPFFFHQSLNEKKVVDVTEEEEVDAEAVTATEDETNETTDEEASVAEELDESLKKDEA